MATLLKDISTLVTCPENGAPGDLGIIVDGALIWDKQGRLEWVGPCARVPESYRDLTVQSANGCLVLPGLVDCHTHLAFGGWRAEEFGMRAKGTSYLEIARAGGGILSTVRATRQASSESLQRKCRKFLREMLRLGVTSVEVKSGYGLDIDTELRVLKLYQSLALEGPQRIYSTFLAHTVPPEFAKDRSVYLRLLKEELIPEIGAARLAEFCDVFLEESAFSWEESRQILEAGLKHGLRPKLHADQLSSGGGAELAAQLGAVSADHLEQASDEGLRLMGEAGVVAVSLPLASFYLRQPPLDATRVYESGARLAIATDFNPGSAPSFHLPMALHLACVLQRMSPAEALRAGTVEAARALGREREIGSLEVGRRADLILIDAPSVDHWLYHFQPNLCQKVFVGGRAIDP